MPEIGFVWNCFQLNASNIATLVGLRFKLWLLYVNPQASILEVPLLRSGI